MRAIGLSVALLLDLQVSNHLAAGSSAPAPEGAPHLEALVKQLGASRYTDREKAQRELEKIGVPALDLLRKAAASEDAEVNRRARELVHKIETAVLTARLLSPTRVNLSLKDSPVLAALAELERQSGYQIYLAGKRAAVEKRTVSLVTGEITFWEALDALCRKAHLVEVTPEPQHPPPGGPPVRIPRPAGAFQKPAGGVLRVAFAAQPVEPPPADPIPRFFAYPANTRIAVMDGKPSALPTCYAGSVRIRALPPESASSVPRVADEAVIVLEIAAEPRLRRFQMAGSPTLRKAIDDQGHKLAPGRDTAPATGQASAGIGPVQVPLRLKLGQQPTQTLKRLEVLLTASTLAPPEPIVAVDHILQAAGQTVRGKKGGSIQVMAVTKVPGGDLQIQVQLIDLGREDETDLPPGQVRLPGARVQQVQFQPIRPGGRKDAVTRTSGSRLPSLVDSKGQTIPLVKVSRRLVKLKKGNIAEEQTLAFRPQAGQGEPARLILMGQHTAMLPIPVSLVNVPLNLKFVPVP
jgi:hypothetical protein